MGIKRRGVGASPALDGDGVPGLHQPCDTFRHERYAGLARRALSKDCDLHQMGVGQASLRVDRKGRTANKLAVAQNREKEEGCPPPLRSGAYPCTLAVIQIPFAISGR